MCSVQMIVHFLRIWGKHYAAVGIISSNLLIFLLYKHNVRESSIFIRKLLGTTIALNNISWLKYNFVGKW